MKILALDIATRAGWALSSGEYGAFTTPGGSDHVKGCAAFGDWLCDLITTHEPGCVFVEGAAKGGKGFNLKAYKLMGVTAYICGLRGLMVVEVSPSKIKKFATGKGNASKSMMVAAAQKIQPSLQPHMEDEADAIWLVRLAPSLIESEAA